VKKLLHFPIRAIDVSQEGQCPSENRQRVGQRTERVALRFEKGKDTDDIGNVGPAERIKSPIDFPESNLKGEASPVGGVTSNKGCGKSRFGRVSFIKTSGKEGGSRLQARPHKE